MKGSTPLVMILLMMFFCVSLVVILQSRFMLGLNRNVSFIDSVIVNFAAESEINDLIIRAFGTYPAGPIFNFDFTNTVAGTTIRDQGIASGNTKTVTVTASRNGATTDFSATTTTVTSPYTHSTIILLLDATQSMTAPADAANPSGPTRYEALRQSVVDFLTQAELLDPTHTKFQIGLAIFRNDTKWLTNASGQLMTPTSDFAQLISAVNYGFTQTAPNLTPPSYDQLFGNTSVGSALLFSKTYWTTNPDPTSKGVEILITDGNPDTAIADSRCAASYYCPNLNFYCQPSNIPSIYNWRCNKDATGNYVSLNISNESLPIDQCMPPAKNIVRCALAKTDVFVPEINQFGLRPTAVDSYVLTVQPSSQINDDVKDIFTIYSQNTASQAQTYFDLGNANLLSATLQQLLELINSSTTTVIISR